MASLWREIISSLSLHFSELYQLMSSGLLPVSSLPSMCLFQCKLAFLEHSFQKNVNFSNFSNSLQNYFSLLFLSAGNKPSNASVVICLFCRDITLRLEVILVLILFLYLNIMRSSIFSHIWGVTVSISFALEAGLCPMFNFFTIFETWGKKSYSFEQPFSIFSHTLILSSRNFGSSF